MMEPVRAIRGIEVVCRGRSADCATYTIYRAGYRLGTIVRYYGSLEADGSILRGYCRVHGRDNCCLTTTAGPHMVTDAYRALAFAADTRSAVA